MSSPINCIKLRISHREKVVKNCLDRYNDIMDKNTFGVEFVVRL